MVNKSTILEKQTLKIFNSLGKKKETFKSINKNRVLMYVCGPTVYDLLHVGNFRGPIFFNFLRNWLEHLGYNVEYVYNYTDIDDKIINRSNKENKSTKEISEQYIDEFKKDYKSLKINFPTQTPKCTEHIDDIIRFIEDLIKKKCAYESEGSVFFSIDKFSDYGKLSGKKPEDLLAGHRVEVNKNKKNPMDFVLWKPSKNNEPGWDSPWGIGRPGWHIECSAMSSKILGPKIDIHGGGVDLLFPHHENEIAQSESNFSNRFANFWIHNNLINFDNQKMSKSLGNIVKARDFIKENNAEIFKFLILSVHYRSILNFNDKILNQTINNLLKIYSSLKLSSEINKSQIVSNPINSYEDYFQNKKQEINAHINNDFNTPAALSVIFELVKKFNLLAVNKKVTPEIKFFSEKFDDFFVLYGGIFGLFQEKRSNFLKSLNNLLLKSRGITEDYIHTKINDRNLARTKKDFRLSDSIRDELIDLGIELKDNPDGSTGWYVKI